MHDSRQQDDNDDDDYNNDICDDDDDDYNDVGDDDDNDDDENYNVLTQFSIAQSFDFHRLPFSAIAENSVRKYLKHQSKVKIKYQNSLILIYWLGFNWKYKFKKHHFD